MPFAATLFKGASTSEMRAPGGDFVWFIKSTSLRYNACVARFIIKIATLAVFNFGEPFLIKYDKLTYIGKGGFDPHRDFKI